MHSLRVFLDVGFKRIAEMQSTSYQKGFF